MLEKDRRLSPEEYVSSELLPVRLIIEDVRSGNNVGSFFRTGDAFRISGIELCGISCHPPHRDILKTALGSSKYVPWRGHKSAIEAIKLLRFEGYKIAAIEQTYTSIMLDTWKPQKGEKWAFVMGNEERSEARNMYASDCVIEIPQLGVKQSMNVSVCAGVVLWQAMQLAEIRFSIEIIAIKKAQLNAGPFDISIFLCKNYYSPKSIPSNSKSAFALEVNDESLVRAASTFALTPATSSSRAQHIAST